MFELSAHAQNYLNQTRDFIHNEIEPIEADFWHEVHHLNPSDQWTTWQWREMPVHR